MIELNEIKSVSVDMSTEETPYNRIYAKPIERQGDVLLCEFESANYDINKKGKDFTIGISEEMYLDQLKVKENMIKSYQEENTKLKEKIVKMKNVVLDIETNNMKSIIEIVNVAKENEKLKMLLKRARDLIRQIDWCESFYAYNDGLDEEINEVLK